MIKLICVLATCFATTSSFADERCDGDSAIPAAECCTLQFHRLHLPEPNAPWEAYDQESNWTVAVLKKGTTDVKGPWKRTDACSCLLYLPPTSCPSCPGDSREEQTSWSSTWSASLSFDVALPLLGQLASVMVSANLAFSRGGTLTCTITNTYQYLREQCFSNSHRKVRTTFFATARAVWTGDVVHWVRRDTGATATTKCLPPNAGATCQQGKIIKVEYKSTEVLQTAPKACPLAPVVLTPDPYDGERSTPCCSPIAGCHIVPPNTLACCGCINQD